MKNLLRLGVVWERNLHRLKRLGLNINLLSTDLCVEVILIYTIDKVIVIFSVE